MKDDLHIKNTDEHRISNAEKHRINNAEKLRMEKDAAGDVRQWLMNQPLTPRDPKASLRYIHDFVQAASLLDLFPQGRYLDFGAGSGWIGEWLNSLGYKTVVTDISLDMLKIARDRHAASNLEPMLVVADGEALPFKPGSFDGVVCVNAFHHLPNMSQALKSIHDVLSMQGDAVFFEPGEGHSQDPRSIYDMEHLGVLEQDVTVEDMTAMARNAGFVSGTVSLYTFPLTEIPFSQWPEFKKTFADQGTTSMAAPFGDKMSSFREHMRRHPLFKLSKSTFPHSRAPGILQADLKEVKAPETVNSGFRFRCDVTVKNTGNTIWLADAPGAFGIVRLGAHLFSETNELIDYEYARTDLGQDLAPGEEITLTLFAQAPDHEGRFKIQLDMVAEGVDWFENRGSTPHESLITVKASQSPQNFDSRIPDELKATLSVQTSPEIPLPPKFPVPLLFTGLNSGNSSWLSTKPGENGSITVTVEWKQGGESLKRDQQAAVTLKKVVPGERAAWLAITEAPEEPSEYILEPDLVWENKRSLVTPDSPLPQTPIKIDKNALQGESSYSEYFNKDLPEAVLYDSLADIYSQYNLGEMSIAARAVASFYAPHVEYLVRSPCDTGKEMASFDMRAYLPGISRSEFKPASENIIDFGNLVTCLGYSLTSESVSPGDRLSVRLFWKLKAKCSEPYTCFIHCYHTARVDRNKLVRLWTRRTGLARGNFFQRDYIPGGGTYPIPYWEPGFVVVDELDFDLPANILPGTYQAEVGLWLPEKSIKLEPSSGSNPEGIAALLFTFMVKDRS